VKLKGQSDYTASGVVRFGKRVVVGLAFAALPISTLVNPSELTKSGQVPLTTAQLTSSPAGAVDLTGTHTSVPIRAITIDSNDLPSKTTKLHRCSFPIHNGANYSYCYWKITGLSDSAGSLSALTAANDNFTGADLSNSGIYTFQDDNLTSASIPGSSGSYLSDYSFQDSVLTGVNWADNGGQSVNFTGAYLGGAILTNSNFSQVIGTPATLPSGWFLDRGMLIGPTSGLVGDNLSGMNLAGRDLRGVDFSFAQISGTDFSSDNFQGVYSTNVVGTPASLPAGWKIEGGYLVGPDANYSRIGPLDSLGLSDSNSDGPSNLSGMNLTSAVFSSGNQSAFLSNVSFTKSNLSALNLRNVSLIQCDLRRANLTNAQLSGADLYESNLSGALVQGANFGKVMDLSKVRATGLIGTPASLPKGWMLKNGTLEKILASTHAPNSPRQKQTS